MQTLPSRRPPSTCRQWHRTPPPRITPWHVNAPAGSNIKHSICCAAIRARWCLDARYGCKAEAIRLLQEWVQTVGAKAGLGEVLVSLCNGAVGCPESRLELEISLESLADWEAFLSRIPTQEHLAWSQRMQGLVVDGSPVWHVYRVVPLDVEAPLPAGQQINRSSVPETSLHSSGLYLPSVGAQDVTRSGLEALLEQEAARSGSWLSTPAQSDPDPSFPGLAASTGGAASLSDPDEEVVLDWKGEPMKINKGDRLPKFL